jgi:hypothetical protein
MGLLTRRRTPAEELKNAAIEALVNALDDDKPAARPGVTGVRAVAVGAVLYTAGRAAFKGRRFVREQLLAGTGDDEAEALEDEEQDEPTADPPARPREREPVRPTARRKGAQPSLRLPNQRRPRIRMSGG